MDRRRVQDLNNAVSQRYGAMIGEMTLAQAACGVSCRLSNRYLYVRVTGFSSRWKTENRQIWELLSSFITGLFSCGAPFSLVLVSDGSKISVYLGSDDIHISTAISMFRGVFPKVHLWLSETGNEKVFKYEHIHDSELLCGGLIKGNPSSVKSDSLLSQIDMVIRGMVGRPWIYSLFAQPVPTYETVARHSRWLECATRCSALADISFTNTDNNEGLNYRQRFLEVDEYVKKVEAFCERSSEGLSMGEWCVALNYAAHRTEDARLLGSLLTSAFQGEDSEPEPVHTVVRDDDASVPLVNGWEATHNVFLGGDAPYPRYASLVSSRELAVYASLPSVDTPGFSVIDDVSFDVHRDVVGDLSIGTILEADCSTGNSYLLPSDELNRHALVVGLTGSGKTNTLKCIIHEIARCRNLPFMVIEPAKKEYWELYRMGFDDLQVYSVGSAEPNSHTLCINPFERASVPGDNNTRHSVPLQTHIDFVYAAFKASFIMYTPMPYVLERAIYEVYEDCGWDIQADTNRNGDDIYPTVEDLYFKIPGVVDAMGYDQKMRRDLIGSLQARINSLRIGSKGAAINVERSFPFDRLLEGRVVVELEDIGDDDAKAFIISLLLVNLLEVRRQQDDLQLGLRHVMLIEEAHRLLRNVRGGTGENADPRGAAVEFFCNLLAELRSKGQGFIVADQIPSKLAPDLVKNTNLKIAHRMVARDERELIGGAMHMRDDQIDALAALRQGVAAVYSEGDYHPKLVRPPYAKDLEPKGRNDASRQSVLKSISRNCVSTTGIPDYAVLTGSKPEVCRRCNAHCGKRPSDVIRRMGDPRAFDLLATKLDPKTIKSCQAQRTDRNIRNMLNHHVPGWNTDDASLRYCVLELLLERWQLDKKLESRLINAYMSNF